MHTWMIEYVLDAGLIARVDIIETEGADITSVLDDSDVWAAIGLFIGEGYVEPLVYPHRRLMRLSHEEGAMREMVPNARADLFHFLGNVVQVTPVANTFHIYDRRQSPAKIG